MFELYNPDSSPHASNKQLTSSLSHLEGEKPHDPSLRKKTHQLMVENFQLKEEVSSLQTELRVTAEMHQQTREKLRSALQEVSASDQLIQKCRCLQQELRGRLSDLTSELQQVKNELNSERGAVSRLLDHNSNLQSEACLVNQLKQKYQLESTRIRLQLEQTRIEMEKLKGDKDQLVEQLSLSVEEIEELRHELGVRRGEMEQYESFVLDRVAAAQNGPEIHQRCVEERDKWYCKYLKYKERSRLYSQERDQLLNHLSTLNREVGSPSIRSYLND